MKTPSLSVPPMPVGLRPEAIRNGSLLDISAAARQAAFTVPVAICVTLWEGLFGDEPFDPADFRLVELAWFLRFALLRAGHWRTPKLGGLWRLLFGVAFDTARGPCKTTVEALSHRGDDGQPVITLMRPRDG